MKTNSRMVNQQNYSCQITKLCSMNVKFHYLTQREDWMPRSKGTGCSGVKKMFKEGEGVADGKQGRVFLEKSCWSNKSQTAILQENRHPSNKIRAAEKSWKSTYWKRVFTFYCSFCDRCYCNGLSDIFFPIKKRIRIQINQEGVLEIGEVSQADSVNTISILNNAEPGVRSAS